MDTDNKIKIVFTGCVGAGKTTAIATISEVNPISTDVKPSDNETARRKSSTTVALDYGELTLDESNKLYLYGTPGQRRFDFMCEILTRGALGLVVLIDNTHADPMSELDYFLNLNARFLREGGVAVIGITHFDLQQAPSLDDYYQVLAERGDPWPVVHVDAREIDDVAMLLETLLAALEYI